MKEVGSLSVVEKTESLMGWEIFDQLETDEMAMIAARTTEVEYDAGEIIDPEDPNGSSLHLILSGQVQLSMHGDPFRIANPSEAFGGMALLGNPVLGEEIKVLSPTHALVLSRVNLERAVADQPEFALALLRACARLIRKLHTSGAEV